MMAIIKRDLRLAMRSGGAWLLGIIFFSLFVTFCVIAIGANKEKLLALAPALIWLAVLFSALLSFQGIFSRDVQDGTLEQLILSPLSTLQISAAKALSFALLSIAPILIALPIAGLMLGLTATTISALCLGIAFAVPAISSYGTMASALMAKRGSGGFLIILISAPFLIPILIFGMAAIDSYASLGVMATEFQAILGLSLIGTAIGLPAAAAALTANLE